MLSAETVLRVLEQRRCLRTAKLLASDEHLVSQNAFPRLYSGGYDREEASYLRFIADVLSEVFPRCSAEQRDELKLFMQQVLRNGQMHQEDFVQHYVFQFWSDLWGFGSHPIQISERYFEGKTLGSNTYFARDIVSRIYEGHKTVPDIIALGGEANQTLYIIEIKNVPLDDRAVGQILRYYQVARSVCDRVPSQCDIRRIVPVLVVPSSDLTYWHSLPYFFREFLEVLYWRTSSEGSVRLVDGKQSLRSIARSRVVFAPGA